MKQIITNKAVVFDATIPNETCIVLFKNITSNYDVDNDTLIFQAASFKVIDDKNEVYELIRVHSRELDKATADSLYGSLTISSKDYTDRMNEELVKGLAYVINNENIFGLVTADLILR